MGKNRLNIKLTLQNSFTRRCLFAFNINGTLSLLIFLSLTLLAYLFITTLEHQSLKVSKKNLFKIYRTLMCPQARDWISIQYIPFSVEALLLWQSCWRGQEKGTFPCMAHKSVPLISYTLSIDSYLALLLSSYSSSQ